jgi:methylglutaconyl-CoA hydratase
MGDLVEPVELTEMSTIRIDREESVAHVVMNRPDKHNAFYPALIQELQSTFERLGQDDTVRVIVLAGEGRSFSAGADLDWMKGQGEAGFDENLRSAREMGELFRVIDRCPKPVVAKVQGAALGGGAGLVCSADIAVAGPKALFGFTEVRLGLVAAVISPFVLRRLSYSVAREKLLTGERFGPEEAFRIGLVHKWGEDLDSAVDEVVQKLLQGSSQAHGATKRLLSQVWDAPEEQQLDVAARYIADARASSDGKEGLAAFLDKRKPGWLS